MRITAPASTARGGRFVGVGACFRAGRQRPCRLRYAQSFPIFWPLSAQIEGSVAAQFSFAFGFDTKGYSEYRKEGSTNIGLIFRDGFYIVDPPGFNQIVLSAGIAASGVVDLW